MQIQFNTDSNIEGNNELAQHVITTVGDTLDRFSKEITEVAVHITDENSDKKFGLDDIRCMLETNIAGLKPIAVRHQAATVEQAVAGAAKKMKHSLETIVGRINSRN